MKKSLLLSALLLLLLGGEKIAAQWIQPATYQQMLGRGMDVDWWTNGTEYAGENWSRAVSDFSDAGIQHIRITLTNDYMSPEDFDLLDDQVNSCLQNGITPIIAYEPTMSVGRSTAYYRMHITDWWRCIAEHYRSYPARLSFDLLTKPNSRMFASYGFLNDFYEDCVAAIRVSNPYRILFIAPFYNNDPAYLQYLRVPSYAGGYVMADWPFLSRENCNRAWNGWRQNRAYQERWINQRIQAALAWQNRTGIFTWVGGWSPDSYFYGNYDSAAEAFTSFLCNALYRSSIPFAFHGLNRFYDYSDYGWHENTPRVMGTLFPRGNFAHSGMPDRRDNFNGGFSIDGRRFGGNVSDNRYANNRQGVRYDNPRQGERQNFSNDNSRRNTVGGDNRQYGNNQGFRISGRQNTTSGSNGRISYFGNGRSAQEGMSSNNNNTDNRFYTSNAGSRNRDNYRNNIGNAGERQNGQSFSGNQNSFGRTNGSSAIGARQSSGNNRQQETQPQRPSTQIQNSGNNSSSSNVSNSNSQTESSSRRGGGGFARNVQRNL